MSVLYSSIVSSIIFYKYIELSLLQFYKYIE